MNFAIVACWVMGAGFVVGAIWGFIAGDRVLIFHVNTLHNFVHLTSGLGALACAFAGARAALLFCLIFGGVYGLVAALGLLGVQVVIDLLHINPADNWLHVGISLIFLTAGFAQLALDRGRAVHGAASG